jgi:DnaJ-class molecular chaperone
MKYSALKLDRRHNKISESLFIKCPDCDGTGYDFGDGGQCDRCNGMGEI